MNDGEPQARGRRRSDHTRRAILAAAYELTVEVGYAELTIEGIAARAGAGKQTLYRWWPSKADVLLEALSSKADLTVSTADRGSFRDDLRGFLRDSADLLAVPGVVPVLRSLMAEAQRDEEFRRRFHDGFLFKRRSALRTLVDRAADRGDQPTEASADLVADLTFGLIWYRILATDRVLDDADLADLERLLT